MMRFVLAFAVLMQAAPLPPPFPRDGATKLIDNERVTVWDVRWAKGVKTPMHEHRLPAVGVVLQAGSVIMTMGDGTVRPAPLAERGRVVYAAPGFSHVEEGQSDTAPRAIVVELKGASAGILPPPAGIPAAFPRAGTTSLLDNDRVAVWNVTWPSGEAPMHFHGTDVVVIGLEGGTTRSLPQTGTATTTAWKFGDVRFNPRGRLHREEIVDGAPRLIAIEIK
jgi:predicted metal-dependent enzyme (double-stranded beta helix superfamily)